LLNNYNLLLIITAGLEHLYIDFDAIEIKREIGKGSFARVYEGVYLACLTKEGVRE
jgi:hypothetical protein